MGAKLTPKQEAFAIAFVETRNASEAYRRSYDAAKMKPETINRAAKELTDNPKITARVRELQDGLEKRHRLTMDDLILELEEARAAAKGSDKPQAAAMVAATMGKAKLLGFLDSKGDEPGDNEVTPVKVIVKVVDARVDDADA